MRFLVIFELLHDQEHDRCPKLSLLSSPLVASGANVVTQTDWITTLSTDVEIGVVSR